MKKSCWGRDDRQENLRANLVSKNILTHKIRVVATIMAMKRKMEKMNAMRPQLMPIREQRPLSKSVLRGKARIQIMKVMSKQGSTCG